MEIKKKRLSVGGWILTAAGAAAGTIALLFYVRWLAWYVGEVSTSVESNALYFLGWIMVFIVVICAEALMLREVHRMIGRGEESGKVSGRDEVAAEIKRQIKETKVLWTAYMGVPALLNLLLFNFLSSGFIFSGMGGFSQYATIATMLRSEDEAERMRGIEAAMACDNRNLGRYLADIIEEGGEPSRKAAWAVGMRKDECAAGALRTLYGKGGERQRGAAVIALSSLGDSEIMGRALEDLHGGKGPRMEIILALGNLPYVSAEDALIEAAKREKIPGPIKAACFWAIAEMEKERFKRAWERDSSSFGFDAGRWTAPERKGWEPMVEALKGDSRMLKCAAVEALRYAGPVHVSRDLVEVFESSSRFEKCEGLEVKLHRYHTFVLVRSGLLRSKVLRSLAGVGDRDIVVWLDKVVADRKNADEVILLAKDLARQIRDL
jgi:hypothetical protein